MALEDCGVGFYVPQRPRRPWLLIAIACAVITAASLVANLYALPFLAWVLFFVRLDEARYVAPVVVAIDRVTVGARSIALADVTSVRSRGRRVVVRGAKYALAFDASLLHPIARALVVRHIEARVLFVRSGIRCTRAERTALEAFHVFDASAVRIHKRTVLEILEGEGPWLGSSKGRVYVRRAASAPTTAYRTNAPTNVVELEALA